MRYFALFLLIIVMGFTSCVSKNNAMANNDQQNPKHKIKVFLLAGQSNMDGRARGYNLTEDDKARLQKAQSHILFYYNHQTPVPLQLTTPSKYVQKKFDTEQVFGPELFFGIKLSEAYPQDSFIFIKRSRGGMSLYGAWNPNWTEEKAKAMNEDDDPKLYSDFINYTDSILNTMDTSEYELCGMLWVQGESDSGTKKNGSIPAETYEQNLRNLINGVRTKFHKPNLPFLIFQVGTGKVVEGMKNIAADDDFVVLIPQDNDENSKYHFNRNPAPLGHYIYESMKRIGSYFFEFYENNFAKNCR